MNESFIILAGQLVVTSAKRAQISDHIVETGTASQIYFGYGWKEVLCCHSTAAFFKKLCSSSHISKHLSVLSTGGTTVPTVAEQGRVLTMGSGGISQAKHEGGLRVVLCT